LVSNNSLFGQALHVLVGYEARPAGMQLVFWLVTTTMLFTGMRLMAARQTALRVRAEAQQAEPTRNAASTNTV
jgi:high-affinity iron transporter